MVGTVTKINRSNDMISVFFLEDYTKAHVIEVFSDKLPYGVIIDLGIRLKVKGVYSFNKFKEKIVRVFRMGVINITEEYLFYLSILNQERVSKDKFFNEEEIIRGESERMNL